MKLQCKMLFVVVLSAQTFLVVPMAFAAPTPVPSRFPGRPNPNALTPPAGQNPPAVPTPPPPVPAATPAPGASGTTTGGTNNFKALGKGKFNFDFSKAQIADIVKVISEISQKNFIIPDKIKSQQVTIICPTPVTADEAYRAFLSALEANDVTVVKIGAFYKLVPAADGAKYAVPTYTDDKLQIPPTDAIVTKLIHLEHSDANAISQILKNFMSKSSQVAVYAPTNALIVSEFGSNLVRIEEILDKLDTEGTADQIRLLRVQYASASDLAQKLNDLFDIKKGSGGAHPAGAPVVPGAAGAAAGGEDQLSISKLIADDRTNQLIVVANDYAFKQIKDLAEKLDVPVGEDTGQLRVIALQNANAEDLASVLSSLAQGSAKKKTPGSNAAPGGAPAANPNPGAGGATASLFEGEVKITADKATNSLVVIGSPRDYRSVKSIVEQLDIRRRQVFVEMAIMEVSNSNETDLGTQWYTGVRPPSGSSFPLTNSLGLINSVAPPGATGPLITSAISPLSLLSTFGGAAAGYMGSPINVPVGNTGTTVSIPSFAVLLKALETSTNANVISTPYLLATDNEESSIEVGQKVAFASSTGIGGGASSALSSLAGGLGGTAGSSATGALGALGGLSAVGGLGGFGTQIQRIDVSLKIQMTPHINDSDRVLLELDEQLEDLGNPANINGVSIPQTTKRALKSKIVVEDQQTIVLGGLIRDNLQESVNKYPFLGDIPIIGWLFKSRTLTKQKSNLLLVITPYIIRSREDFQRIYERKQKEYKAFVELFYGDSKQYHAVIDYTHKNGPFALMSKAVKSEMNRAENGGHSDNDVVIMHAVPTETKRLLPRPTDPVPAQPNPPAPGSSSPSGPPPSDVKLAPKSEAPPTDKPIPNATVPEPVTPPAGQPAPGDTH